MIDFEKYSERGKNYEYVMQAYKNLRELLQGFKPSNGGSVNVFLQGSYKNNTNIDKESDIDIVIYYDKVFHSNIKFPKESKLLERNTNIYEEDKQRYDKTFVTVSYNLDDFKTEIRKYLEENSSYIIGIGNKTIKCKIPKREFSFDIVCAFEYRFYDHFDDAETDCIKGNIILDKNGKRIINFPQQSYQNSEKKNKECKGFYKETIRIIKNIMKNEFTEAKWIPSFALESILYNVDDTLYYSTDKQERVLTAVGEAYFLVENNWDNLFEPNELLFVKRIQNLKKIKALLLLEEMIDLIEKDSKKYDISNREKEYILKSKKNI